MKIFILIIGLLINSCALAHQLSTAYLTVAIDPAAQITGTLQVRLLDLAGAIALDENNNNQLSWGEITTEQAAISAFIQQHLTISRANLPCNLLLQTQWMADEHFNEGYLVIPLQAQCALTGPLAIEYAAFMREDSSHKLIIQLSAESAQHTRVISSNQTKQVINLEASGQMASFTTFIYQGMVHIWQGLDHILFLVCLLISCVMTRQNGHWQANNNKREVLLNTAWLVSAFTLAHSITLSLTALNIVQLPSGPVEVIIAASVAFAAFNNIVQVASKIRLLTLLFGLVHGMGFAGVLSEIGVPADNQLASILAFNLGVEIGQAILVLGLLPILFFLPRLSWYRRYGVWGISGIISLTALFWVSQRI